jgi:HK97 family phage portal protein
MARLSKLGLGLATVGQVFGFGGPQEKTTNNELASILYSQLVNHQAVVFYDFSEEDYIKKGYCGNAEVYTIIRKIVDKSNSAPCYLYIDKNDEKANKARKYRVKKKQTDPIEHNAYKIYVNKALEFAKPSSDLAQLIENPNDHQSWSELNELFDIFYFAQGEAFLYRETAEDSDIALSLHVAPANLMTPIFGGDYNDVITGWKLKNFIDKTERKLDAKDVFHLKMSNPQFDQFGKQLRGMSPLTAGLRFLTQNDRGLEAWTNVMSNEGVKGIVSPNVQNPQEWITASQIKEVKEEMDKSVNGNLNAGKVTVSAMPMAYAAMGLSPQALNVVEGLKYSGYKLSNLWGVPPVLFEPDPTYSNKKEARKEFVSDVIIPYQNKKESALNRWLVKPFIVRDKLEYVLDYDTSVYEELKLSVDQIDALLKVYTINEVRIMLGADELIEETANQVFIQSGLVPLSDFDLGVSLNDDKL